MRKSGCALAGVAVLSLVLAGCKPLPPVHYLPPQAGAQGCDEIITFGARLPLPEVVRIPGPQSVPEAEGEEAAAALDWESDPASDPVGRKLLEDLSGPLPTVEGMMQGPDADPRPLSESILILSGGSQQGAFGAGFMSAWEAYRGGTLPRFRMVTGISTGALQATFAFLGDTETIVREYSIEKESELLRAFVDGKFDKKPFRSAYNLWARGTIARLDPLRKVLKDKLITPGIMEKVAIEAGIHQRRLLVGAVEMGSGELAVFDLGLAAIRYMENHKSNPARAEQFRMCYIEALIASSSVPMSAAPVFIDNRLYIDGGARFGVLVDFTAKAYQKALARAQEEKRESGAPKNLFVIVNATLEVPRFCGLTKCEVTADGTAIPPKPGDPHPDWNFLQLAQRSVSVMINQAYRSSVFVADKQGVMDKFSTQFVRLDPAHLQHKAAIAFPGAGTAEKICFQWQKDDEQIDNPKEFFPRYMRCLIDYGRKHDTAKVFAAAEPK
jgi:hypothetical protein